VETTKLPPPPGARKTSDSAPPTARANARWHIHQLARAAGNARQTRRASTQAALFALTLRAGVIALRVAGTTCCRYNGWRRLHAVLHSLAYLRMVREQTQFALYYVLFRQAIVADMATTRVATH